MALSGMGLVIVGVWFRCRCLGNLPGVNGDEAWYGLQSLKLLQGGRAWVRTPTGNPPNPFFFAPLVLLHAWFPPSVALLRSVAVASGLVALAVNGLLCRWVFDRITAAVSTVLLAIWPVTIAYSRFAWDASQSVLATLPVVYLSLATLRFPHRRGLLSAATAVALLAAVWVHPTNFMAAAVTAASVAAWPRREKQPRRGRKTGRCRPAIAALLAAVGLLGAAGAGWAVVGEAGNRWLGKAGGIEDLARRGGLRHVPALVARLHTGETAYRYIPGSQSWLAWPGGEGPGSCGVDIALFWAAMGAAVWMLGRSAVGVQGSSSGVRGSGVGGGDGKGGSRQRAAKARRGQDAGEASVDDCPENELPRGPVGPDRALLAGWALTLVGFLLVAGPSAMLPGWERYALCLVAPTTLVLARGAALAYRAASSRGRWLLAAASLLGWLLLADFEVHYFRFLRATGGRAHATFRTGPVEPKAAALRWIAAHPRPPTGDGRKPTWIVTTEWWNYWPLRYLAADRPEFRVVSWEETAACRAELETALGEGRVWLAEFPGSLAERRALARADELSPGLDARRRLIRGYGREPVLSVIHLH